MLKKIFLLLYPKYSINNKSINTALIASAHKPMINTSENLIIIKGQIKTPEIENCQNYNGNYKIVFRNSASAYTYKDKNHEG